MRFQSFFMLMIDQPCIFAMLYIAWLKVPTLVSGNAAGEPGRPRRSAGPVDRGGVPVRKLL